MRTRIRTAAATIAYTTLAVGALAFAQDRQDEETVPTAVVNTRALVGFENAWCLANGPERDAALALFAAKYMDEDLGEDSYLIPLAELVFASDASRPGVIKRLAGMMIDGGALSAEEIDRIGGAGMTRTIVEQVVAPPIAGMISRGDALDLQHATDLLASSLTPEEAYVLIGAELKRLASETSSAELTSLIERAGADVRIDQASRNAITQALDRVVAGQRSMLAVRGLQMMGESHWAPPSKGVNEMGFRAVEGPGLDGITVGSNDHLGKVVVVHYWDSTCTGCTKQSKELVELRAMYDEDELVIIGVNMDRSSTRDSVERAASDLGMAWDHIYTGEAWNTPAAKENEVYGIPLVVVLDRQGRPRDSSMGMRRLMDDIRLALAEESTR